MRAYILIPTVLLTVAFAQAQTTQSAPQKPQPATPAQPVAPAAPSAPEAPAASDAARPEPVLTGEKKIRAICKKLDLTDDQWKQVESFIQVFQAELDEMKANPKKVIEDIEAKYGELKDAKNAGDNDRVKRLKEELRALAPTTRAERHFFETLAPILTDAQKTKLERIRRMESVQTLKPGRVLQIARKLDLTPQQDRELERVSRDFRSKVAGGPNASVEDFIRDVRAVLTNTQQEKFDAAVDAALNGDENSESKKPAAPTAPAAPATPATEKK